MTVTNASKRPKTLHNSKLMQSMPTTNATSKRPKTKLCWMLPTYALNSRPNVKPTRWMPTTLSLSLSAY